MYADNKYKIDYALSERQTVHFVRCNDYRLLNSEGKFKTLIAISHTMLTFYLEISTNRNYTYRQIQTILNNNIMSFLTFSLARSL